MELGKLIGKGNTADVFDYGKGRVCKLFISGYPKQAAEKEYECARIFSKISENAPAVHDFVCIDGRYGIIYEKAEGETLLQYAIAEGTPEKASVMLASLQKTYLEKEITDRKFSSPYLFSYKTFLKIIMDGKSENTDSELSRLPDGSHLCHGDFHFENVLVDKDGRATIIDFMNVCLGPKEYDIARTYYLISHSDNPENDEYSPFRAFAAESYLNAAGVKYRDIECFLPVIDKCHRIEIIR